MRTRTSSLVLAVLFVLGTFGGVTAQNDTNSHQFHTDHFKCYKAFHLTTNRTLGEQVFLDDQFDARNVRVRQPIRICNPVNKAHGSFGGSFVQHPDTHLVCYRTREPEFPFPGHTVQIRNQFGVQILNVIGRERTLCVPSDKCIWDPTTEACKPE